MRARIDAAYVLHDGEAVRVFAALQAQVDGDDVVGLATQPLERVRGGARALDDVAARLHVLPHSEENGLLIVHDQDAVLRHPRSEQQGARHGSPSGSAARSRRILRGATAARSAPVQRLDAMSRSWIVAKPARGEHEARSW